MVKAAKVSIMYIPLFIKQIKKAETCLALFNKKAETIIIIIFLFSYIFHKSTLGHSVSLWTTITQSKTEHNCKNY